MTSRERGGERITVASLNTRGTALTSLTERYRAIARWFEASSVDVVGFQEVLTYYHLRQLTRQMPSFRHIGYRPSIVGPAGGVLSLSRLPVADRRYHRFPPSAAAAGLPRLTRFRAGLKGTLVIRLARPELTIVTTHPVANTDGDWSASSRFHDLQRSQLAALADIAARVGNVGARPAPLLVCGDFNVARDSALYDDFITRTGLVDVFDGGCPPTFHAEYLPPDRRSRCIDFILADASIRIATTDLLFTEKHQLSGGPTHLSDHIGLCATLVVPD